MAEDGHLNSSGEHGYSNLMLRVRRNGVSSRRFATQASMTISDETSLLSKPASQTHAIIYSSIGGLTHLLTLSVRAQAFHRTSSSGGCPCNVCLALYCCMISSIRGDD